MHCEDRGYHRDVFKLLAETAGGDAMSTRDARPIRWAEDPYCVGVIRDANVLARSAASSSIGVGHVIAVVKGRVPPAGTVARNAGSLALTPRCQGAMNALSAAAPASDSDALQILVDSVATASGWSAAIDATGTQEELFDQLNGRPALPESSPLALMPTPDGSDAWSQRPWGSRILRDHAGHHVMWDDGRPAQYFVDSAGRPVLSAAGRIVHVSETGDLAEFDVPDDATNWPPHVHA